MKDTVPAISLRVLLNQPDSSYWESMVSVACRVQGSVSIFLTRKSQLFKIAYSSKKKDQLTVAQHASDHLKRMWCSALSVRAQGTQHRGSTLE